MRSHNLLQGHLWVLIPAQEVHGTKESCPSLGWMFTAGIHVLSVPPNGFSYPPWKNLPVLHCRLQPVSLLLHAISKKVAFSVLTGCAWFFSNPFSAFLLLHQLSAVFAFCSQTLFAGQTLKLYLSLPSSVTPLMSTQKNPGNSQGTSSIIKSSACMWVSFQKSYHSSRKSQLRL